MKRGGAGREINREAAAGKEITADKNIVWRIKGNETHDISLDITRWQRNSDPEIGCMDGGKARLVNFSPPNWLKVERRGQGFTDTGAGGPGVNLSESVDIWAADNVADNNLDRRPIFENIIDRLAKFDLGPNGFFIVCHSDLRQR